jgi:hypothetical protein
MLSVFAISNNFLTIQLVEQAQVFVVSDDEFMEKMK